MKTQIHLQEDVLNLNNNHYSGDYNWTMIEGKIYSFLKGFLIFSPRSYCHSLYNVNKPHSGCYLIRHFESGKVYVGSGKDVYARVVQHKGHVIDKKHQNSNFRELTKTSQLLDFEIIVFFTDTREEAYELEQFFVDKYKDTGQLLNLAHDVRIAMRGYIFTDEHKRKISETNTGKIISNETRVKMSNIRKTNDKALAQMAEVHSRKRRRISVHGREYESITAAVVGSGLSDGCIRKRVLNPDSNIFYLEPPKSPLNSRTLSLERRQEMSNTRKTNPALISQFKACGDAKKVKVQLNGITHESISACARAFNIGEWVIRRLLRSHNSTAINGVHVVNDKQGPWYVL